MGEDDKQLRSLCVLVVEDAPSALEATTMALERNGYQTRRALNGKEAFEILVGPQGSRVSLVLTDIVMPVMGGVELARRMRERGLAPPILMMSASTDADLRALGVGPEFVLRKPFTRRTLLRAVQTILGPARTLPPK